MGSKKDEEFFLGVFCVGVEEIRMWERRLLLLYYEFCNEILRVCSSSFCAFIDILFASFGVMGQKLQACEWRRVSGHLMKRGGDSSDHRVL